MKNIFRESILSKIVLVSLLTISGAYASSAENETAITHFGKFVFNVEKTIADFFNASNKTSYATFVTAFENILLDFKRSFEPTTRTVGDELTKLIYEIADYAQQQFSVPFAIIKRYNGKPSSEAPAFSVEIKRDFNTEKVFSELLAKLKVLKTKAVKECETTLATKIETVIAMIEKKRKEWNAKSDFVLFAGLQTRMNAK